MKKLLVGFASMLLLAAMVGTAGATSFTLGSIDVSLHDTDPGLVLGVDQNLATPITFDLNNVGDSFTANLFTITTDESSVNEGEDTVAYPISATFNFTDPSMNAVDTGSTYGTYDLFLGFIQYNNQAHVTWDDPVSFNFGNTGQFSLDLSDLTFNLLAGYGQGDVYGTMTLTQADTDPPTPTPEPATMLLFGTGLAGLAGSRRRKNRKA